MGGLAVNRHDGVAHLQRAVLVGGAAEHDRAHRRLASVLIELEPERARRLVAHNHDLKDFLVACLLAQRHLIFINV